MDFCSRTIFSYAYEYIAVSFSVRQLERARDSYNGNDGEAANHAGAGGNPHDGEEDSSEEANANGGGAYARRTKKMKTTNGSY